MLLAPLRYWLIKHPVKRRWDLVLPGAASLCLTGLIRLWPAIPAPFGGEGYVAGLQNLYAILGGFFVAALTLLVTAESKALEQPLTGTPRVTYGAETAPLDRKRFLCLLFGYLSFSCFGLYLIGLISGMLAPGGQQMFNSEGRWWIGTIALAIYNFWLSHVFIATLVGLYYFTDRLQRPDPELIEDSVAAE